jgi:hypothetical protein
VWRDPTLCPFKPGSDYVPDVWAGRQDELTDFDRHVRPVRVAGQYERGRALLGEAGIGKSALAARLALDAQAADDIVVPRVRVPRGADVLALVARALTQTVHDLELGAAVGDRLAGLLGRVRSIARVEVDAPAPPPNPHVHLTELLVELGRYAAERGKLVLVLLDEVQNVADADHLSQLLVALADALAHTDEQQDAAGTVHRRVLPLAVYLTALPEFYDQATTLAGATFARRFKPIRLATLDDTDVRVALAPFTTTDGWPVGPHRPGVVMDEEAVDRLVGLSLGDPFLLQLAGHAAWNAAPDEQVITVGHVNAGWASERGEARSHVERLLNRLPERERELVDTMAALAPSGRTLTAIATRMGRSANQLGSAAQRLEEHGIIARGRPYTFAARTVEALLAQTWP